MESPRIHVYTRDFLPVDPQPLRSTSPRSKKRRRKKKKKKKRKKDELPSLYLAMTTNSSKGSGFVATPPSPETKRSHGRSPRELNILDAPFSMELPMVSERTKHRRAMEARHKYMRKQALARTKLRTRVLEQENIIIEMIEIVGNHEKLRTLVPQVFAQTKSVLDEDDGGDDSSAV